MSISDFPPVSLDKYIANTNKGPDIYKKGQDIYKIYKRFDDSYDPNNPEAVRDAMIKTAVKTGVGAGLAYILPKHWITGVALTGVYYGGKHAEFLQRNIQKVQCPKEDSGVFHGGMDIIPSCRETKEGLILGLEGLKRTANLLKKPENAISQYAISKADQYGITTKNFKEGVNAITDYANNKAEQYAINNAERYWGTTKNFKEGVKVTANLLKETENIISEYTHNKAEQYGITKKNIRQIAEVAHRYITEKASPALKQAYHEWLEAPLLNAMQPLKMRQEELQQLNTLIMQSLLDKNAQNSHFNRLETQFGHVFKANQELSKQLREVRGYLEDFRQQDMERMKQEAWNRKMENWNTIFSSLSQAGAYLKVPILRDIGTLGSIGVSAANSISQLSALTPALSVGFVAPCFSLASAAIALFSFFDRDEEEDTNAQFYQLLMEHLAILSNQIATVRKEMHGRFDHVDKQLEAIHMTLQKGMHDLGQTVHKTVHNLAVPTLLSLQEIRTAIEALYHSANYKLDLLLLHDFEKTIGRVDDYTGGVIPRNVLNQLEYNKILSALENIILRQSASAAFNGTLYNDMTSQGINRLLSTKETGHILGFLGLYAQTALNIKVPGIDVSQLCNPYLWSTAVARYLKFRKTFSSFSHDEESVKLRDLLNSGKKIIDYLELLTNDPNLMVRSYDNYRTALQKLSEFAQREFHQKMKDLFKEIGFTSDQTDFTNMGLMFDNKYTIPTEFLLGRKATPLNGQGEPRLIDRFYKYLVIPQEYVLADRLGVGKLEFTYTREQRPVPNHAHTYDEVFEITCNFVEKEANITTPVDIFEVSKQKVLIVDKLWPETDTWSQGIAKESSKHQTLRLNLGYASNYWAFRVRFAHNISRRHKEFALNLIDSKPIALTSEFQVLLNEVDAQSKLLMAYASLTGRSHQLEPLLQTEKKIKNSLLNYAASTLHDNRSIALAIWGDADWVKQTLAPNALRQSPLFMQQVQRYYKALNEYATVFIQQRAIIKAMGNTVELLPSESSALPEPAEDYDSDGETIEKKDRKIEKLNHQVSDLTEEISGLRRNMEQLALQNKQILQLLLESKGVVSLPQSSPSVQLRDVIPPTPIAAKPPASVTVGGLPNMGNTCYMNAALQALLASPKFRLSLTLRQNAHALNRTLKALVQVKDNPMEYQKLYVVLEQFHHVLISDSTNPDLFGDPGRMKDSAAVFEAILSAIQYPLRLQTIRSAGTNIFPSVDEGPHGVIHLPLDPNLTMQQIVNREFNMKEQHDSQNLWEATLTTGGKQSLETFNITRQLLAPLPELLVFQYPRKDFRNAQVIYNGLSIAVPADGLLDMRQAFGRAAQYKLIACVNYHESYRHYTADVLNNNEWFHCDDPIVSKINRPSAEIATLLLFERL